MEFKRDFWAFGVPLDPDPGLDSVIKKTEYIKSIFFGKSYNSGFYSPYEALQHYLMDLQNIVWGGELFVESWLTPKPDKEDITLITPDNFFVFIETNGCKEYADAVKKYVIEEIFPYRPFMIGCDHSVTGGVLEALSENIGRENLTLIILDNHLDAILPSIRNDLIGWARERSQYTALNPFAYSYFTSGVPDTYNSGSFLYFLIKKGVLNPSNVILIGAADYPPKELFKEKDVRVKRFLDCYLMLEKMGGKIIRSKNDCIFIKQFLNNINTPFVYVSFDADIGYLNAFTGCRTKDVKGFSEIELYNIAKIINETLTNNKALLVGFDIMEIDVYEAGKTVNGTKDRTYEIISKFIKIMLGV